MQTVSNSAAFPQRHDVQGIVEFGLTKREYFAGLAMQGMLANDWQGYAQRNPECELLAQASRNFADALIKALNEQP